jgi:ABC-type molybdate transport system substrate-binding protein
MAALPARAEPVRLAAAGSLRAALAEVFASANMEHLEAVAQGRPTVLFARNRLCAPVRPGLEVAPETLLDRMLDPATRLGTSTPGADPSGDYAFTLFLLSPAGQAILARHGVEAPGLPATGR